MRSFGKEETYEALYFHRTESRLKCHARTRLIIGMVLCIMVRGRGLPHPYSG